MTPSIIECLDDPALFAGHFKGDTWGPWRTVLKALFGLHLDETETALYRTHTGRLQRSPKLTRLCSSELTH